MLFFSYLTYIIFFLLFISSKGTFLYYININPVLVLYKIVYVETWVLSFTVSNFFYLNLPERIVSLHKAVFTTIADVCTKLYYFFKYFNPNLVSDTFI